MQVTEEDGGRLNAFAKEPRMVLVEQGETSGVNAKLLWSLGLGLVVLLLAVAARIS